MINAVFLSLPLDKDHSEYVVRDANKWADEVYLFGAAPPKPWQVDAANYVQVDYSTHKNFLDTVWAILPDMVDIGDWVVLLNCDEIIWSKDALKKAALDPEIKSIAFRRYLMWDAEHYDANSQIIIRALRHFHKPVGFPDMDMVKDAWSPVVKVGNYVPLGEMLATRWVLESTRKEWGDEMINRPWRLDKWEKGRIL